MNKRDETVSQLRKRLKSTLAKLKVYKNKFKVYRIRYRIQLVVSVFLMLALVVTATQWPISLAAPQAGSVTITSDADWNLGTLDDITVSSGSIQIDGSGGANWL